ncbi:MAG TPA: RluA family pseudouridine synthase [Candidatus Nanopelagicaceae bacterium]|nr:RluA family pseudouridine synthase [Candidatus Nanopelagicaceae bacterium]
MAEPAAAPEGETLLPVGPEEAGVRLDSFLATRLGSGRTRAHQLVVAGLVRVGGMVVQRPSTQLSGGAIVSVGELLAGRAVPAATGPVRLVYQDDLIAVVDKPAGMVVHPAPAHHGTTLADVVRDWEGPWSSVGGPERPGIVHRLDRGTSGLLVLARTDDAHRDLAEQLRSRALGREYWALASGSFREDSGRIEAAVGRDRARPRRMSVTAEGRDAATEFFVLERLPHHTALRLRLLSGRTHQIRVHLAYIGHPLEGDPLYSGAEAVSDRPALHAAMLHLRHPGTGREMIFCSRLPEDLETVRLELGADPGSEARWPWSDLEGARW